MAIEFIPYARVFEMAIKTYGERTQEEVAMEECAELIQAIAHKHRGRKDNIAEEIADVEIMLEQLKMIYGCGDDVEQIKQKKIERLSRRLKNAPAQPRRTTDENKSEQTEYTSHMLIDNLKIIAYGWDILHLTPMARDKLLMTVNYIKRLEAENKKLRGSE